MDKKWITKKDESGENMHIPIRSKKPFGVQREMALRDVEKLREMGLRARLIETNRKNKLYAPYESAIDKEGNMVIKKDNEIKEVKKDATRKVYHTGNYIASVFHPLAFEDGAYTVSINRDGVIPSYNNTYFTQVMAKSPASAFKEVINTPNFMKWKDDLEKRIKEGKVRTDYHSKYTW